MLQFPQGASLLAPLFAAASTVHIGKGSVYGMDRPFLLSKQERAKQHAASVKSPSENLLGMVFLCRKSWMENTPREKSFVQSLFL